jgi:hypothetical protein
MKYAMSVKGWAPASRASHLYLCVSEVTVVTVWLMRVFLSETDKNEEGIKKVFDKNLWRANVNF